MIYANSVPIGRAYYNGWLAEIYMGGTLVWSGYKKVGGEADVEIQLRTTAEGTVAVFVPVSASPLVQISAAAHGSTAETIAPSAAAKIAVSATPTPDVAAGVGGAGGETLTARTTAAALSTMWCGCSRPRAHCSGCWPPSVWCWRCAAVRPAGLWRW